MQSVPIKPMESNDKENIFRTFYPFYIVLKTFGLAPYKINVDAKRIEDSKSPFYTAIYFSLYLSALIAAISLGNLEPLAEESLLVRYGSYLLCLLYISTVSFCVAFNYLYKREEIATCIVVMHHFDCMLMKLEHTHVMK